MQPPSASMLKVRDIKALTALSGTQIHKLHRLDPTFPAPVRLGARAIRWPADEVLAWVSARLANRGG